MSRSTNLNKILNSPNILVEASEYRTRLDAHWVVSTCVSVMPYFFFLMGGNQCDSPYYKAQGEKIIWSYQSIQTKHLTKYNTNSWFRKKTRKTRSRGNFIKNPIANNILYGERLKAFLLRLETRYGCLLSSLLVNIVLGILASAIGKKNNKRQQVLKEKWDCFYMQTMWSSL